MIFFLQESTQLAEPALEDGGLNIGGVRGGGHSGADTGSALGKEALGIGVPSAVNAGDQGFKTEGGARQ